MATQKVRRPTSGTYSADGGKFYFLASASFTASAISVTVQIVVTDAFKSSHNASYTYNGKTKKKSVKKKKTYTLGTIQVKKQSVGKINFACAGKKTSIGSGVIKNTSNAPNAPSLITAELINDARIDLTVTGTGYTSAVTHKVEIERCRDVFDTNAFSAIPSSPFTPSSTSGSYIVSATDQSDDIERGHRYWFRARAYNSNSGKSSKWVYSAAKDTPVYTSSNNDALSGTLTATRVSNKQVDLVWIISSVSYVNNRLVQSFEVFRSTDGGSAVRIGTVAADTAHVQYTYIDSGENGPTADHTYSYQIKIKGEGTEAETMAESSDAIHMSPAHPQSVTAAHDSSGDVIVTIVSTSNTATQVCIERRIDGGSWVQIAEEEYVYGGQQYKDDSAAAQDTIEYRVRNKCDQLTGSDMYSTYTVSAAVSEKSKPAPPTILTPVDGSSVLLDTGTVRLSWQHNSTDGSSQENAMLTFSVNGGSASISTKSTQMYHSYNLASRSAGDMISWSVKTRGAYRDAGGEGGYSDVSRGSFSILTRPQLHFTSPETGDLIEKLPVKLSWDYTDQSGTLQKLTVSIRLEGREQASFEVPVGDGASGSYSYDLTGFLFENDTVYSLTATALSSTGFSSTSDISITIGYEEVSIAGGLIPVVSFDDDGIATIVTERDETPDEETGEVPEPADIAAAYLYRLHDRTRVLVAENLDEGMQVSDRYAPLNVVFSYELLMLTAAGEVSVVRIDVSQESSLWFVYWDNGIARAEWNPEGQVGFKRPEKTLVRYSGRRYPVAYDSKAMEETFSFSSVIFDREELDNFRQMMRDGGSGIWKSGDGDVYDADFSFSYSSDYKGAQWQYSCTLSVTRIDGGTL